MLCVTAIKLRREYIFRSAEHAVWQVPVLNGMFSTPEEITLNLMAVTQSVGTRCMRCKNHAERYWFNFKKKKL